MSCGGRAKGFVAGLQSYRLRFRKRGLVLAGLMNILLSVAWAETHLKVLVDGQTVMETIHTVNRTGTLSLCGYGTSGLELRFDNLQVGEWGYSEDWSSKPVGAGVPADWARRFGPASVWSIQEISGNRFLRLLKGAEAESTFRIAYEPGGVKAAWVATDDLFVRLDPDQLGDANQTFFVGLGGADTTAYAAYKISYLQSSRYLRLWDDNANLCMYTYDWPAGTARTLTLSALPTEAPLVLPGALKVMTYNIHQAQMGDPPQSTYTLVRQVIQTENPDVVGLQETTTSLTASLATDLGYYSYFSRVHPLLDYGNGILSKYPLLETQTRNLPSELLDPRVAQRAKIAVGSTEYQFFNTHFDHDTESTRISQANDLVSWAAGFSSPQVLLGDFNSRPNSPPFNILEAAYDDANRRSDVAYGPQNTVSNPAPTVEIDHVFAGADVIVYKAYVSDVSGADSASDHRPAVAWVGTGQRTNTITVRVNGSLVLSAQETVSDDPNVYTRGSFVVVTSGSASGNAEILLDDLIISAGASYQQNFETVPLGGAPAGWRLLYRTPGFTGTGEVVQDGANRVWRQWSQRYVKYDYAPGPYPTWQEYAFRARVKTVNLPSGTKWRMNVYNYPMHDTAYETYRIECNADGKLYLRRGAVALDSVSWSQIGLDPYQWNTFEISTAPPSDVSLWNLY